MSTRKKTVITRINQTYATNVPVDVAVSVISRRVDVLRGAARWTRGAACWERGACRLGGWGLVVARGCWTMICKQ